MRRLIILAILAIVAGPLCSAALLVPGAIPARQNTTSLRHRMAFLLTRQEAAKLQPQMAGSAATGAPLGSGDLIWYGGQVEEQPRVFLIFWGFAWNNGSGGLTRDAALVKTFFSEASNTPYQTMLTQYTDRDTSPSSTLTLGGVWLDSQNPPANSQTCGGPTIDDSAIQNEIAQAIKANSWPSDVNASYLLYTPNGYFVNQGGGPAFCSEQQFCAYHGMSYTAQIPYAVIPFPTGEAGARERPMGARGAAPGAVQRSGPEAGQGGTAGCMVPNSPNNNLIGDSLVNLSSVEQANITTDPHLDAYFDDAGFEIGDKCAWTFSTGPMTLDNGDAFELQTEYSNSDHACFNIASQPHTPRQGPGTVNHLS
ncbi:MAG TPA: hypothetical protein VFU32_07300 [Ktedonobacterales bacterium]|nr:hypothetical protein [Ktedonobacterales bacterium]